MKNISILITILFLATSCGIMHNVPQTNDPNVFVKPNMNTFFVDQNGNFYPANWKKTYGNPPRKGNKHEYSLKKKAIQLGLENDLSTFEKNKIAKFRTKITSKKRVFIFVHGYNADIETTEVSYNFLKTLINTNEKTDEIIKFYWDGLVSQSPLTSASNWFSATSFSQMAGEFGLRRLLNTMKNKEIFIISHSRGASVVLSALTTPPFKEGFVDEIKAEHDIDIDQESANLLENKNKITCIMLAPAVGLVDFQKKDTITNVEKYINFTPQLKRIHITTNNTDNTLKKFIGFMSKRLTPTDLGYKDDLYNQLTEQYPFFEKTDFTGMKSHEFKRYIHNPKFKTILKEYNLLKK